MTKRAPPVITGMPSPEEAARIECDEWCRSNGLPPCGQVHGDAWDGTDATCAMSKSLGKPNFNCRLLGDCAIALNKGRARQSGRKNSQLGKSRRVRLPPRKPELRIVNNED